MAYRFVILAALVASSEATCNDNAAPAYADTCLVDFAKNILADPVAGCAKLPVCFAKFSTMCASDQVILGQKTALKNAAVVTSCAVGGKCVGQPLCGTQTTTLTPWDSSASSDSGTSLDSLYSSSFKRDSSSASIQKSSSADSSGSTASGSSGSYMQIWQWLLLLASCCLCIGVAVASMIPKPKPKKKKPTAVPAPAAQEPEGVVEPLIPALVPFATTSQLVATPQYAPQMSYAAPVTTAYAAPATTVYAAPATTAYAQPAYAQQYAAPATTAYSTGGGPMGTMSGYNAGGIV